MFHEIEGILQKAQTIVHEISQYRGAIKEIRDVTYMIFFA